MGWDALCWLILRLQAERSVSRSAPDAPPRVEAAVRLFWAEICWRKAFQIDRGSAKEYYLSSWASYLGMSPYTPEKRLMLSVRFSHASWFDFTFGFNWGAAK